MGQGHTARVDDVLELVLPPTLCASHGAAFESPVGVWEGEGITVLVDATIYADELAPASASPRAVTTREAIGGRPARIVAWDEDDGTRVIAARFDGAPGAGSARSGVTVVVRAAPHVASEIPFRIIRSVRFL